MTQKSRSLPFLAAVAAVLLLLPAAAHATDAPKVQGERIEIHTVDVSGEEGADGQVHEKVRVVVGSPDGDGEVNRFVWRGESQDGENFVWRNEDGQVIELGDEAPNVFFSRGVERGFLGVELTELTPELRSHFGATEDRGVLIGRVVPDSPAAHAGLRVGDVLTHIDGEPVAGSYDVTRRIGGHAAGEVVGLELLRDGRVEALSATLEVRERPQVDVRKLIRHRSGDGPDAFTFHLDEGEIEDAMEGVRAYFESDEWEQEMGKMGDELRQRLEALEVELDGLEERFELDDIDIDFDVEAEDDTN